MKCYQWYVVNGTTYENTQPSDMPLSIGAWSEDMLNDIVRIFIHKVNMCCAGNSARPPGDLFTKHRLIVDCSTGLWIDKRFWANFHSWETDSTSKGNETPLQEKSARKSKC